MNYHPDMEIFSNYIKCYRRPVNGKPIISLSVGGEAQAKHISNTLTHSLLVIFSLPHRLIAFAVIQLLSSDQGWAAISHKVRNTITTDLPELSDWSMLIGLWICTLC